MSEDSALVKLTEENCKIFREAKISQATIDMQGIQVMLQGFTHGPAPSLHVERAILAISSKQQCEGCAN
jgi:hypothetical protein